MNKILIIAGIVFVLVFTIFVIVMRSKTSNITAEPTPTLGSNYIPDSPNSSGRIPTPTTYVAKPQIAILSSNPVDAAKDLPLDQAISVTIDPKIPLSQVIIILQPPAILRKTIEGNTLTFSPSISWKPAVTYNYTLRYQDMFSQVQTFSTLGGTPTPYSLPPQDSGEINQKNALAQQPDVYLHNILPYDGPTFKVEYAVNKSADTSYDYYFMVTSLTGSDVHDAVHQWLISQKLSEAQISKLDIRYK